MENHQSWLGGFAEGLFDSTIGAIGTMIAHPIKTVEGLGHAIAHPVSTVEHVGLAVWQGGKAILAGDGHAAGMAVGSIGMISVPFMGEAGAAGDVAEVSKVADVADVADASKALEAGDTGASVGEATKNGAVEDSSKLSEGAEEDATATASSRLPRQALTKEGWPNLPETEAPNFVSADPVTLNPGEDVYSVIDDPKNAGGSYWSRDLPANKSEWRSDYAVKPEWNDNGLYVKHTITEPTNVWEGPASSQGSYAGGKSQLWMERGTLNPTEIKPTGW